MPLSTRRHTSEWRDRNRVRAMDLLRTVAAKDPAGIGFLWKFDLFPQAALMELLVRSGLAERGPEEWTYRLTAAGRKAGRW